MARKQALMPKKKKFIVNGGIPFFKNKDVFYILIKKTLTKLAHLGVSYF